MTDPVNASIVAHFQTLEDPRIERTKKHNLLDIWVIALCTLLTGGDGFQDMEWIRSTKGIFALLSRWRQRCISRQYTAFACRSG